MADTIQVLSQTKPGAASLTTGYTAGNPTVVSSIVVCNQSSTATSFRISVAVAGAGDTAAQYLYYDVPINGNDTFVATLGISLAATDVIRVYNTLATLSFNIFGIITT